MLINFEELGIKEGYLYEILATTFRIKNNELIPNASCMGITIKDKDTINLNPYPTTHTFKNLKENGLLCINFVESIYLYTIAALKGSYLSKKFNAFPLDYYGYYDLGGFKIPFIKQAWAILICEVINELPFIKKDILGEINLSKFTLKIKSLIKFNESHKFFNRAENLTLEAIILTTRMRVALEAKKDTLIGDYQSKINEIIKSIRRFGKNPEALKSINLIEEYLENLRIKF